MLGQKLAWVNRDVCVDRTRNTRHGMHVLHGPGHVKNRRRRVALFTEYAVAISMRVVLAHMVFAGEGVFEVARAFVNRSAFRAATFSVVHTGSHFSLAFDYGSKSTTKYARGYTKVTFILLLICHIRISLTRCLNPALKCTPEGANRAKECDPGGSQLPGIPGIGTDPHAIIGSPGGGG